MIKVDAHHHVWRLDRGDYGWITPDMEIYRDYSLDDLRPSLDGVEATVLIQAAETEAETAFLLDIAKASGGLVRGVVGWTDLAAPDAPLRITAMAADTMLKGLRPMNWDTAWIMRDTVQASLRAMAAAGLCFDALIEPRHLPLLPVLHAMHPNLKIVIDHAAKPPVATGELSPWAEDLARAARETTIVCKISGLSAQAGGPWMMNDMRPWVDCIVDSFGPSRCMWGSDWPVLLPGCGYERWKRIVERFLFRLELAEQAEIMGGTAIRFYGLE